MRKLLIILLLFPVLNFSCIFGDDSSEIKRDEWTIMVYSNADNNLEADLLRDLKEMEDADVSAKYLKVIVLIDRTPSDYSEAFDDWTETKLYEVTYNNSLFIGSKELSSTELRLSTDSENNELDMGDYNNLAKFVDFCKSSYPAEHYALIIEDHGDGWYTQGSRSSFQISRSISTDETSGDTYIGTDELSLALENKGLDIIAMDACLMGMIEVVYELRNCASYVIASPKNIPGAGNDYTRLFEKIYDRLASVEDTAEGFVDAFNKTYKDYDDQYLLCYDTAKITDIVENDIDKFVTYLKGLSPSVVTNAKNSVDSYPTSGGIELISFAEKTGYTVLSTKLKEAAYCGSNTENRKIAIYYPDTYDPDYDDSSVDPEPLDFSTKTEWDDYLESVLNP